MTTIEGVILTCRRALQGAGSRWRNLWFRLLGMRIDGYVWLRAIDVPRGHDRIQLHRDVALDHMVSLISSENGTISIGERTYINRQTIIDSSEAVSIGNDCMIGPACYITDHDHAFDGVRPPGQSPLIASPTSIGDRVWLGTKVTVLKGVTIGDGAVIGAGSIVTKDVPAGSLALGAPAQITRSLTEISLKAVS